MGKINLLSSEIYNRISAGEVVERPYSVVKELMENAIDAGATSITVEVENGGISLVRVTDDGEGMDSADLARAFLPHATSKIKKAEDLNVIQTLGFRGEALPSIGAVAKVEILSCRKDAENGNKIHCNGGELSEVVPASCSVGTTVTVEDLFYNTPARAKFLKTPKGEESDISNMVSRLILAHPSVAFTYIADGKTVYRSFGGNPEEALIAVYGVDAVENCYYIDTVKNGLHIYGYLGKHFYTKSNRTYQTVVLNGRYVINQTVATAIHNAYQNYLMKRNYPFYCLYIDLPGEFVDVNVHPNKADVRFASNQVVYGSLYSVVSSVLDGTSAAIDIVKNYPKEDAFQGEKRETATVKPLAFTVEEKEKSAQEEIVVPKKPLDNTLFEAPKREEPAITYAKAADGGYGASSVFDANLQNLIPPKGLTSNERDAIFAENQRFLRELDTKKQETKPIEPKQEQVNDSVFAKTEQPATISVFSHANYVGQAFKTYLIFEMEGVLYFVDQHAAHERMIYDKLLKQMKDQAIVSQPMLFPYHLTVNPQEERFIKENLEVFNELGIEIQEFGLRTYRVSAVPADLVSMDLGQFFAQTLKDAEALNGLSSTDIRKEKLMQAACKSAIKAGFSITEKEIDLIGEKLSQNPGLTCPHGRPVAVKVSKTELEKWFKRIV
ncbi:MAG: DNA mismatch repair endonuclease MutL [Clostridiales bacterium]|nr:DNA mismatch repair endonuclease MutL [Clostridiales bacterium]